MLKFLFEQRGDPLEKPETPLTADDLLDYYQSAGQHINEDEGMKFAAVSSCIRLLSSSVAQLPLNVLRKTKDTVVLGQDHAAFDLLRNTPNGWQTSYDWREMTMGHSVGWGNGLSHIIRNVQGEIKEISPLYPWETALTERSGRFIYANIHEGKGIAISPEDMIHIRAIGSQYKNYQWAVSPIRQHAESIGLGLAAQRYGASFFNSGGKATGIVSPKDSMGKEVWERFKESWKKITAQLKTGEERTVLLPAEVSYQSVTIPPEEAQFLESRKMSLSEVAGIFNVPKHMIGEMSDATFSNISEQAIHFVRHSLMPWVVKWEQELNRKLFTQKERQAGYYVKLNLAGLLRGTAKERAEFYHYAITDGWMNRNEARILEDMNPIEELDEMLVSVNAQPLSLLKQKGEDGE